MAMLTSNLVYGICNIYVTGSDQFVKLFILIFTIFVLMEVNCRN